MGLTNKPRRELDTFDMDIKLTLVQLKALRRFPYHWVLQSEMLAWCRKHGFGRDKTIASLDLLVKKKLIYREFVTTGVTLFDMPVHNTEARAVGYKINSFGQEFWALFEKVGIPKDRILDWGGKPPKSVIDSKRRTGKKGGCFVATK